MSSCIDNLHDYGLKYELQQKPFEEYGILFSNGEISTQCEIKLYNMLSKNIAYNNIY